MLAWHQPDPRREFAARLECRGIRDRSRYGRSSNRSDAGDSRQAAADRIRLVFSHDRHFDCLDALIEGMQFRDQDLQRFSGQRRHGDLISDRQRSLQLGNTVPAHRPDNPEFPKVSAQRIDQYGALPDQQVAYSMLRQGSLLARRLYRHETHARASDRFADGRSVRCIGLTAADIRLHIGWRDQANLVPIGRDQASPIVSGSAGFDTVEAGCKIGEETGHLRPLQLLPQDNLTGCIYSMHLKYALAQIETQRGNLRHGRLPSLWRSSTTTSWHIDAVQSGPSTPSTSCARWLCPRRWRGGR